MEEQQPKPYSISHSKLAEWRRCRQRFHWHYIDKIFPPSSVGQARGTAGHVALASWHVDYQEERALKNAWLSWTSQGYREGEDWDILETSLGRYFEWSRENDTFIIVKSEQKFVIEFEYPANIKFTGFIDGVVTEDNQTWLLENKFYKKMDNSTKDMDMQVALYLAAAGYLGYEAKGVIYNMVRVADTKIAVKEPVVRQRVYRNPRGLGRVLDEALIQTAEMIDYEQKGGKPYRNPTKDCSWDCAFYSACLSMSDDGIEPKDLLIKVADIRR